MDPDRLDASVAQATSDAETVTPDGERIEAAIAGVLTASPPVHVDHRGRLFEVFPGPNEFWSDPVVFGHAFSVRAHSMKGWGLHFEKDDRYTLMTGEVMVALWDARLDSPTHGVVQRVYLSGESTRQVLIPAGVWHATINLADGESLLIDFPTKPYDHAQPDKIRLSWNTPLAPVDLAEFFPIQFDPRREHDCS